jgi:hypothetical protein
MFSLKRDDSAIVLGFSSVVVDLKQRRACAGSLEECPDTPKWESLTLSHLVLLETFASHPPGACVSLELLTEKRVAGLYGGSAPGDGDPSATERAVGRLRQRLGEIAGTPSPEPMIERIRGEHAYRAYFKRQPRERTWVGAGSGITDLPAQVGGDIAQVLGIIAPVLGSQVTTFSAEVGSHFGLHLPKLVDMFAQRVPRSTVITLAWGAAAVLALMLAILAAQHQQSDADTDDGEVSE